MKYIHDFVLFCFGLIELSVLWDTYDLYPWLVTIDVNFVHMTNGQWNKTLYINAHVNG